MQHKQWIHNVWNWEIGYIIFDHIGSHGNKILMHLLSKPLSLSNNSQESTNFVFHPKFFFLMLNIFNVNRKMLNLIFTTFWLSKFSYLHPNLSTNLMGLIQHITAQSVKYKRTAKSLDLSITGSNLVIKWQYNT